MSEKMEKGKQITGICAVSEEKYPARDNYRIPPCRRHAGREIGQLSLHKQRNK